MAYITSWVVTQKNNPQQYTHDDDFWTVYSLSPLRLENQRCVENGLLLEVYSEIRSDGESVSFAKKWVDEQAYLDYCQTKAVKRNEQKAILDFTPVTDHGFENADKAWVTY